MKSIKGVEAIVCAAAELYWITEVLALFSDKSLETISPAEHKKKKVIWDYVDLLLKWPI